MIEGIPWAMSPTPLLKHQWKSVNVKYELKAAIKKSKCKNCKVYDFIDIKIAEDTIVQPDAVVVCKEINKPFLDFPATIVVEILSPFTAMKDRNNKFYIYQTQKIPYYLIIDVDKKEVEIYHLKEDGKYQLETFAPANTYIFKLDDNCSVKLLLDNIWK